MTKHRIISLGLAKRYKYRTLVTSTKQALHFSYINPYLKATTYAREFGLTFDLL